LDFSAAESFKHAAVALKRYNVHLKICGLREHHQRMLTRAGLLEYGTEYYNNIQQIINMNDSLSTTNQHQQDSTLSVITIDHNNVVVDDNPHASSAESIHKSDRLPL